MFWKKDKKCELRTILCGLILKKKYCFTVNYSNWTNVENISHEAGFNSFAPARINKLETLAAYDAIAGKVCVLVQESWGTEVLSLYLFKFCFHMERGRQGRLCMLTFDILVNPFDIIQHRSTHNSSERDSSVRFLLSKVISQKVPN